jgi:hypothetical protein
MKYPAARFRTDHRTEIPMRLPSAFLALAFAVAAPVMAQDYPKMKPGQWETATTASKTPGAPAHKSTMCTDEAIQKQMMDMSKGMQREMCSKSDIRREGSNYIADSVCQIGQSTMTSHSVMAIQGDTSYKTVINTTYDPPLMGMKDSNTTVEAKFVGPCRDGLQPGDVVMPDGKKFNMKSLPGPAPAAPPAKANQEAK